MGTGRIMAVQKWLAAITAGGMVIGSAAAFSADLVVPGGETLVIGPEQAQLQLDALRLEDGARIQFAPEVRSWQVRAEQAWIGEGVRIEGNGATGAPGTGGPQQLAETEPCAAGARGVKGENGLEGTSGVSIAMELGLVHFHSLGIFANGGNGGAGGEGGRGGRGGVAADCHAGAGGDGGRGGDGGHGGAGGEIRIHYWSANQRAFIPVSNFGPGIQIENFGGKPGARGQGGRGGAGGEGGWSKRGSGKTISRNSGEAGRDGIPGEPGRPGKNGKFLVQPMAEAP